MGDLPVSTLVFLLVSAVLLSAFFSPSGELTCRSAMPHDSEDDGAEGRHREQDGSLALQYRVDKLVALACAQLDMLSARASQCT